MAATARVTVLFDPAEKAALQSHALAARISTGEYIKRAVSAYEMYEEVELTPDVMAQLETYAELLNSATRTMNAQLDATIARIDYALDPAREDEIRARVTREIAGMDLDGVADLFRVNA
ncbi:hypothetical protein [Polymorphobacter megasporae]|uniref:hypothetical protein n=1 Tax=Glacieibacterium megasporae TaxID=2835787 RepID=UPI001C1DD0D8|nr:hypothetical protein [Polymorphobacter megasporae]UAJ10767.1 hypothetical protein KTC28_03235 [Polymorphobacter megasporae]